MTQVEDMDEPKLHVVEVLNARELVVSGGGDVGLSVDQVIRVLGDSRSITDPLTNEDLGEIRNTKALVRVYEVADRYALARTFRSKRVNVGGIKSPISNIFSPPKYETRTETLERDTANDVEGEIIVQPGEIIVQPGDEAEVWRGSPDDVPSATVWR